MSQPLRTVAPVPQKQAKGTIPAVGLIRVPGQGLKAFRALVSEDQIVEQTEPNLKMIAVSEAKKFMGRIFEVT